MLDPRILWGFLICGLISSFSGTAFADALGIYSLSPSPSASPTQPLAQTEVQIQNTGSLGLYFLSPSSTTSDSRLILRGTFDPSLLITSVWVRVFKEPDSQNTKEIEQNGEEDNDLIGIAVKNGAFSANLSLREGTGSYKIEVLYHTAKLAADNYYLDTTLMTTNRDPRDPTIVKYLSPNDQVQSDNPEIIALAQKITQGLDDNSVPNAPMEKVRAIHDWVAKNITYDAADLYKTVIIQQDGKPIQVSAANFLDTSSLNVLHVGNSICQGYANLVAALTRAVGIPTKEIGGFFRYDGQTWDQAKANNQTHAWDAALVNNQWIVEDATDDAGWVDPSTLQFSAHFTTRYFNPDPATLAINHLSTGDLDL